MSTSKNYKPSSPINNQSSLIYQRERKTWQNSNLYEKSQYNPQSVWINNSVNLNIIIYLPHQSSDIPYIKIFQWILIFLIFSYLVDFLFFF